MKAFLSITISNFLIPSIVLSQNTIITSISKSNKQLAKVYHDNPITLYCGCSFEGKTPDFSLCGYVPKKNNKPSSIFLPDTTPYLLVSSGLIFPTAKTLDCRFSKIFTNIRRFSLFFKEFQCLQ